LWQIHIFLQSIKFWSSLCMSDDDWWNMKIGTYPTQSILMSFFDGNIFILLLSISWTSFWRLLLLLFQNGRTNGAEFHILFE
jgi:hypothetical protein